MVDCITWIALATLGAPCIHTVSSNMSAEFLRPAGTEGEYLYCEGTASKVGESESPSPSPSPRRPADAPAGRRMAFTRIDFRNEKGQLVAFGSHTHAVLPETRPHEVVFSDDGETAIPVAQGKL